MANVAFPNGAPWGGKALPGQDELPSEDGEPMETGFHDAQDALLKDTLMDAWRDRRDFFVAGNMFVYFSERQIRANDFRGPDVFVVLDTEPKGRKSWVAWEEGGKLPDVVIGGGARPHCRARAPQGPHLSYGGRCLLERSSSCLGARPPRRAPGRELSAKGWSRGIRRGSPRFVPRGASRIARSARECRLPTAADHLRLAS